MAARTVNLGKVGFGLEANTKALESSLRTLKAFGKQVDAVSKSTEEGANRMYTKYAQIERTLTSLYARVSATTTRMKQAGVAAAEIDKVDNAYKRLTATVTKNAETLSRSQIARGTTGMAAILSQGNRLAAAKETNTLANAMKNLERSAIIAVGPLSGIGARLAVLAALFESTTASMAIMIAGFAGATTILGLFGVAAVKATMDQQKFNAQLSAATGSAALAADEYQHVLGVANKLGLSVRDLIEPYAKFTTSARLSGFALDEQRKVFLAAATAGSAMRLSSERLSLVFLAFEQMLNKGTVQMQEMKRQLGDQLPGAFELAAQAMGKSTSEFSKMITNGEVLAKDLLPKLADLLLQIYSPAALQAAASLQGKMNILKNSTFEAAKAFDTATGATAAFTSLIVGTTSLVNYLSKNMDTLTQWFGAIVGAGAGYGFYLLLLKLPSAIEAVTTALKAMRAVAITTALANLAASGGALLPILLAVGAAAAGAYVGFQLFKKDGVSPLIKEMDDWMKEADDWLGSIKQLGAAPKQVAEQMKAAAETRIKTINTTIAALQQQMQVTEEADKKRREASLKEYESLGMNKVAKHQAVEVSPEVQQMQKNVDSLIALRDKMVAEANKIAGVKLLPDPNQDLAASTAWDNWAAKLDKAIRKFQSLGDQVKSIQKLGVDNASINQIKGLQQALDFLAEQPKKGQGKLEELSKSLEAAGIHGATLKDQLVKLFSEIDNRTEAIKKLEKFPETLKKDGAQVSKMFDDLASRERAANGATAETLTNQERLEKNLTTLKRLMVEMNIPLAQQNVLLDNYKSQWDKVSNMEDTVKETKRLEKALESLESRIGDSSQKAAQKFADEMSLIAKAQEHGGFDQQRLLADREKIQDDYYRTILDKTTIFGRSVTSMMKNMENDLAKSWADMMVNGTNTFGNMFKAIETQIVEFIAKVAIIGPIMKGLFGSLYTQKNADKGTGLFEDFLTSIIGPKVPYTSTTAYLSDTSIVTGAGKMQHGGDFMVGSNGPGGTDSQLVQFLATPGETVSVTPPGSKTGANVQVNVINQTGVQADAQQGKTYFDGEKYIVNVVMTSLRRSNSTRREMKNLLAAPT